MLEALLWLNCQAASLPRRKVLVLTFLCVWCFLHEWAHLWCSHIWKDSVQRFFASGFQGKKTMISCTQALRTERVWSSRSLAGVLPHPASTPCSRAHRGPPSHRAPHLWWRWPSGTSRGASLQEIVRPGPFPASRCGGKRMDHHSWLQGTGKQSPAAWSLASVLVVTWPPASLFLTRHGWSWVSLHTHLSTVETSVYTA